MKMRLDTKKIYLAMAEKGLTATEIAGTTLIFPRRLPFRALDTACWVTFPCKALDLEAKDIIIIED